MGKIEVKDIKVLFESCAIRKNKFLGYDSNDVKALYTRGDIVDAFECDYFSIKQYFYDYIGYFDMSGFNANILNIIKPGLIELIDSLPIDSEGFVDFSSLNCDKKTESMLAILAMKCMLIKPIWHGNTTKYIRTREKDKAVLYFKNYNYTIDEYSNKAYQKMATDEMGVRFKLEISEMQQLFGLFGLSVSLNDVDWNRIVISNFNNQLNEANLNREKNRCSFEYLEDSKMSFAFHLDDWKSTYQFSIFDREGNWYEFVIDTDPIENKFKYFLCGLAKKDKIKGGWVNVSTLCISNDGDSISIEMTDDSMNNSTAVYKCLSYATNSFESDYSVESTNLIFDVKEHKFAEPKKTIRIRTFRGKSTISLNRIEYTLSIAQARECSNLIASHPKNKELIAQVIAIAQKYASGIEEFISANFPQYNHLKNNNPTDYTVFAGGELINLDEIIKSMSNSQEEFQKSKNQ